MPKLIFKTSLITQIMITNSQYKAGNGPTLKKKKRKKIGHNPTIHLHQASGGFQSATMKGRVGYIQHATSPNASFAATLQCTCITKNRELLASTNPSSSVFSFPFLYFLATVYYSFFHKWHILFNFYPYKPIEELGKNVIS